ncbi:MAG TPA: TolC family protein, partial [Flavobacterium sp.]|nr:TolC family protein [Flavobacterium sp.]
TAYNRYTIGKASKLEWLNSQVDLNTDATNLLRQKELLANAKARLNEQLAREVSTDFVVSDEVEVNQALQFPELKSLAEKQNPQLQAQIINKQIAEYQLKQVRSARYPQISVNTGYAFNDSYNSLGFNREAHAQGLTYGFSASINIFDGLLQKRNENIAQLNIKNAEVAINRQAQAIDTQLLTNFTTFTTNLQLVELERKNEEIARENLDITLAKYRIGTIPTLEIRAAQLNYLNASVRYANALYQAKLSEISLQELTGSIAF